MTIAPVRGDRDRSPRFEQSVNLAAPKRISFLGLERIVTVGGAFQRRLGFGIAAIKCGRCRPQNQTAAAMIPGFHHDGLGPFPANPDPPGKENGTRNGNASAHTCAHDYRSKRTFVSTGVKVSGSQVARKPRRPDRHPHHRECRRRQTALASSLSGE